jgi:hypothetical protein
MTSLGKLEEQSPDIFLLSACLQERAAAELLALREVSAMLVSHVVESEHQRALHSEIQPTILRLPCCMH